MDISATLRLLPSAAIYTAIDGIIAFCIRNPDSSSYYHKPEIKYLIPTCQAEKCTA